MTPDADLMAETDKQHVVNQFLSLVGERGWSATSLSLLAAETNTSLATLRSLFNDKISLLEAYAAHIDVTVLKKSGANHEEAVRERLFDLLIERLEIASPHKSAMTEIRKAAFSDPLLSYRLNKSGVRSLEWILRASGLQDDGALLTVRAQALLLLLRPVLETWLKDDDPGMARTMARLDKELRRAESLAGSADRFLSLAERLRDVTSTLTNGARKFTDGARYTSPDADLSAEPDTPNTAPFSDGSSSDSASDASPPSAEDDDDLPTIAEFEGNASSASQATH